MSSKAELRRFFREKQIPYESFSIEHNGTTHRIDTDFLIDLILNHTSEEDQGVIQETLFQLDRRNLTFTDYFKLLAEGYVRNIE